LPLAIKDLFCTKGTRTTAASKILGNFVPPYESTVTQNLWDAGAVMLGKTNLDEFAMGSSNETSAFVRCSIPGGPKFQRQLVPGGSSAGLRPRWPPIFAWPPPAPIPAVRSASPRRDRRGWPEAHLWPLLALRHFAFASSLDQAGPMTKTVRDAAIMLKIMASVDAKDSTAWMCRFLTTKCC